MSKIFSNIGSRVMEAAVIAGKKVKKVINKIDSNKSLALKNSTAVKKPPSFGDQVDMDSYVGAMGYGKGSVNNVKQGGQIGIDDYMNVWGDVTPRPIQKPSAPTVNAGNNAATDIATTPTADPTKKRGGIMAVGLGVVGTGAIGYGIGASMTSDTKNINDRELRRMQVQRL